MDEEVLWEGSSAERAMDGRSSVASRARIFMAGIDHVKVGVEARKEYLGGVCIVRFSEVSLGEEGG